MNNADPAPLNRRTFLKTGVSALVSSMSPFPLMAAVTPKYQVLSFHNIHTGEELKTCYRANGRILGHAMTRIGRIMRDHRTGDIESIDPALMDLLYRLRCRIRSTAPISIISGYRSPKTNAALRRSTPGVARNSLHMAGRAIDIRIPGCRTADLRREAVGLAMGGVGYYPDSNFVHLDTGPFKAW